jgi:hypothetical protein
MNTDLPPDTRVVHAREALAGYDKSKGHWTGEVNLISQLAAALRSLLTLVDDYTDEEAGWAVTHADSDGVWLNLADAHTVDIALDDAAELLGERVAYCGECGADVVCEGCASRAERVASYRNLRQVLGGAPGTGASQPPRPARLTSGSSRCSARCSMTRSSAARRRASAPTARPAQATCATSAPQTWT